MHGNHWGSARVLNDSIIPVSQRKSVDLVPTVLPRVPFAAKKVLWNRGLTRSALELDSVNVFKINLYNTMSKNESSAFLR